MRFEEGTYRLAEMVGHGRLRMTLAVDQIYALAIESGFWRTGPLAGVTNSPRHGGKTHFLRDGLFDNHERYLRNLAHQALEPGGLVAAASENVEDLNRQVMATAPRESGVLGSSGHPTVSSEGVTVYDRPPLVPRLARDELKRRHEFMPRRRFGRGASR